MLQLGFTGRWLACLALPLVHWVSTSTLHQPRRPTLLQARTRCSSASDDLHLQRLPQSSGFVPGVPSECDGGRLTTVGTVSAGSGLHWIEAQARIAACCRVRCTALHRPVLVRWCSAWRGPGSRAGGCCLKKLPSADVCSCVQQVPASTCSPFPRGAVTHIDWSGVGRGGSKEQAVSNAANTHPRRATHMYVIIDMKSRGLPGHNV